MPSSRTSRPSPSICMGKLQRNAKVASRPASDLQSCMDGLRVPKRVSVAQSKSAGGHYKRTGTPVPTVVSASRSNQPLLPIAAPRAVKRSLSSLVDPFQTVQSFLGQERCPQDAPDSDVLEAQDLMVLITSHDYVATYDALIYVRMMLPPFKLAGRPDHFVFSGATGCIAGTSLRVSQAWTTHH